MWVQLLVGPRAPESSEKTSAVKWGAYSREYSEAIEPACFFLKCLCDVSYVGHFCRSSHSFHLPIRELL